MEASANDITRLLTEAAEGRQKAWEELAPLIYKELKSIAGSAMSRERSDHTLQPTALVHEAFVRLVGQRQVNWTGRTQFFRAAAQTMRRILVDHARRKKAVKRGGNQSSEPLDLALVSFESRSTDMLDLDNALQRLATLDPQQAEIVELRFFGGLTVDETAQSLGLSPTTVERSWRTARAWLLREVSR